MDWYESRELKEYYRRYEKLSRADLTLGGLTLGFFAAILLATLGDSQDFASVAVRTAVALALAAGAVTCLVGALTWGRPANLADERKSAVIIDFDKANGPKQFNSRSRAA